MRSTLSVKIILPSKILLEIEANMVNLPGEEGVFGVLPGHCKLISNISTGIISVFLDEQEQKYFIFNGVAQVDGEELNIISEFAADLEIETKTGVMNYITLLENSLPDQNQDSLQLDIILDQIEKHKTLLRFL